MNSSSSKLVIGLIAIGLIFYIAFRTPSTDDSLVVSDQVTQTSPKDEIVTTQVPISETGNAEADKPDDIEVFVTYSGEELVGEVVSNETFRIPVDTPTQHEAEALDTTINRYGLEYTQFEIDNRIFLFDKYPDEDDQTLEVLALNGDMDAAIELAKRGFLANDDQLFLYWNKIAIANGAIGPIFTLARQYQSDPFSDSAIELQETTGVALLPLGQSFEASYAWARVAAMRGSYAGGLVAADYAKPLELEEIGRGEILAQRLYQELSEDRIRRLGNPFELLEQRPQEQLLNTSCGHYLSFPCRQTIQE